MNMTPTEPGWHRGDWMQTYSGRKFYPTAPDADDITLEDIAHSLGMLCRYAGHVDRFYSVAEHSVKMARWLLDSGGYVEPYDRRAAVIALLHDATEAYVVDVPRPLKLQMPEYQAIEARVELAVWDRFDVEHMIGDGYTHNRVKLADTRILLDERAALMSRTRHAWGIDGGEFSPLGVPIEGWTPERATFEFLAAARALGVD